MAFARWDPVRDLLAIQQRLARYAPGPTGWQPPVDVHETDIAFILTAEVAGVLESDISVEASDQGVRLSGVRGARGDTCEQYHCIERGRGAFSRHFDLPLPIQAEAISAVLKDGVLTVTCPKAVSATIRRVQVT